MQQELKTESTVFGDLLTIILDVFPPPAATVRDLLPPNRGRLSFYGSRSINKAD